jgi:hypothetical protein
VGLAPGRWARCPYLCRPGGCLGVLPTKTLGFLYQSRSPSWSRFFRAPSTTSLSAPSFSSIPACPLTEHNASVSHSQPGRCPLEARAMFHSYLIFSFQISRIFRECPSITNIESPLILSGWFPGAFLVTDKLTSSSPIWFNWLSPGTLIVRLARRVRSIVMFRGSWDPYNTPFWALGSPRSYRYSNIQAWTAGV